MSACSSSSVQSAPKPSIELNRIEEPPLQFSNAFSRISQVYYGVKNIAREFMGTDLRAVFESAVSKEHKLAVPIELVHGGKFIAVTDPNVMKCLLNDKNGLVHSGEDGCLRFFRALFPSEKLSAHDLPHGSAPESRKRLRDPLAQAFSPEMISTQYKASIKNLVSSIIPTWSKTNKPIDLIQELRYFTCRAMCQIVCGINAPDPANEQQFYKTIGEAVKTISELYARAVAYQSMDANKLAEAGIVIHNTLNLCLRSPNSALVKNLLQLESHADPAMKLTRLQTRILLASTLIGAQETTLTALTETFWQLCQNSLYQDQIANEEFEESSSFTTQVIIESLRLNPPISVLAPRFVQAAFMIDANVNNEKVDSYGPLKENEALVCCPFAAARDPLRYTNPHQFDPRRHNGSMPWLPFGFGPNECLGGRLFFALAVTFTKSAFSYYFISTRQTKKPSFKWLMSAQCEGELPIEVLIRI